MKNEERKSLRDISWKVDEETYRQDPALSYSTLARFERTGFTELNHLFDKIETPSLTFGSAVDAIITGDEEEFNSRFIVADVPDISDSLIKIVKLLFHRYKDEYTSLSQIPDNILAEVGKECNFYAGDKYENYRIKLIKEGCKEYYDLMFISDNKTILSTTEYRDIQLTVEALKNSESTRYYFESDSPFDPNIERLYQLKFKMTHNNINYRIMADLLIVHHEEKLIIPVDLKTSSHAEWEFYKSFFDFFYHIQCRLYWRVIRDNMDRDPYFKNFKLADYRFVVVNRKSLTPLVWECPFTSTTGSLYVGKLHQYEFRDPYEIGEELNYYLENKPRVPKEIYELGTNNLSKWLNTL